MMCVDTVLCTCYECTLLWFARVFYQTRKKKKCSVFLSFYLV